MAAILIIDDRGSLGRNTKEALVKAGHGPVELVCNDYVGEFYDDITQTHFGEKHWDVLVLDINFQTDDFGGVWLYNKLIHGGFHTNWNHTIIYSKYAGDNIAAADSGEAFDLRIFADTAGIPFDCVLPNTKGGRQLLVDRVNDLLGIPRVAI